MTIEFVGIGDLHLDSGLRQFIPDFNRFVCDEVRKVLDYARRNGITLVVLYGDICHRPTLSADAIENLLVLLGENTDLRFVFLKGNHDHATDEKNSLSVFKSACAAGILPNLRVVDKPCTLFQKTGTPLRLLPWPFSDTSEDCLNVLHLEVDGAAWDGGRKVSGGFSTDHVCVAGHLHTRQKVKSVHFSGTLYQTSFGEKPKKYFHHVVWEDDKLPQISCVRHHPSYMLHNLIVSTREDLDQISDDPHQLYKVFVAKDVVLQENDLARGNIVRHNFFSSKEELKVLIQTELELDDESWTVTSNTDHFLDEWLSKSAAAPATVDRAKQLFAELAVKVKSKE